MPVKRKTAFQLPYAGIDEKDGFALLYGLRGDHTVIFRVTNPVQRYSADPAGYTEYHNLLLGLVKTIGDGHTVQKLDIFSKRDYQPAPAKEYLREKYQEHFRGREYTVIETFLAITKHVRRGTFYVHDPRALDEFNQLGIKIEEMLSGAALRPQRLGKGDIDRLVTRMLTMDFRNPHLRLENILSRDTDLRLGSTSARCISLVDTDTIDMPETVSPYVEKNERDGLRGFPVDTMDFLHSVPGYRTLIYSQVVEIPQQQLTLNRLEQKRKRHSGVPDAANQLCVEDISRLLEDVARENQLLVNAHFNIMVAADPDQLDRAANFIERSLFQLGIIPSANAYNQLELLRCALPGNAVELKKYDRFLTTAPAALCLWFKESLQTSDPSDFLVNFTDRQGSVIGIDLSDHPMRTQRISNRNRFCLGSSGTGKSYCMNAILEQYLLYNMDVVVVDTGDSYSGLCAYYGGKYITYTESNPITMNPFAMERSEFNLEKKDFLRTLIGLVWKGPDGRLSQIEDTVLSNVLSSYYYEHFWVDPGPANPQRPDSLRFDTFYDYSVQKIGEIREKEMIPFDLDEYRYVLRKFYSGNEYGTILNEASDKSLFTERFIIFEIDSIKENRTIFSLVTLVIMDVFIQKMRHRKDRRKALIIEEAWKAIASPLMAGYILFLYKTVRKFWGEVIVVTQELSDIIGNEIVKDSILNNSDTILLLDQSKFRDNYDEIAKLLSISDAERRKIFTVNRLDNKEGRSRFKEVYIRRGSVGEVYGVEVSTHQYLTYTTEKPEKIAVERYLERYGSYREGLDAFVADLHVSGLPMGAFVAGINTAKIPTEVN
jgi:conjugation system TraG family ATPase